MKLTVQLTTKTVIAGVIKMNHKTVWVRLPDGNIIKRHINKHVLNSKS